MLSGGNEKVVYVGKSLYFCSLKILIQYIYFYEKAIVFYFFDGVYGYDWQWTTSPSDA